MKFKTFWACTGCDKTYHSQRWGLKHLTTAHDGCSYLDEFTPEYQQQLMNECIQEANDSESN